VQQQHNGSWRAAHVLQVRCCQRRSCSGHRLTAAPGIPVAQLSTPNSPHHDASAPAPRPHSIPQPHPSQANAQRCALLLQYCSTSSSNGSIMQLELCGPDLQLLLSRGLLTTRPAASAARSRARHQPSRPRRARSPEPLPQPGCSTGGAGSGGAAAPDPAASLERLPSRAAKLRCMAAMAEATRGEVHQQERRQLATQAGAGLLANMAGSILGSLQGQVPP
jgi:hypothetical protein